MSEHNNNHTIWAVVPAAGIGKRMQSAIPKQYLQLNETPILAHTVNRLLGFDCIAGLVIALQPDDPGWDKLKIDTYKPVVRVAGGDERCNSVLNALNGLRGQAGFNPDTDWVMVHDAVRPCLRRQDVYRLLDEVKTKDGGLLALPVRDTMKRQHKKSSQSSHSRVAATVEREGLWHALTPQYFPWKQLKQSLETAILRGYAVTDESSAMEQAGYSPQLVCGHEDNIKITRPGDLELAGLYLSHITQQDNE